MSFVFYCFPNKTKPSFDTSVKPSFDKRLMTSPMEQTNPTDTSIGSVARTAVTFNGLLKHVAFNVRQLITS
jgi:hypothetical protein